MKKRRDSFFGLHFDFHAGAESRVAEEMRPDVIARLLDEVRPDYVQIDTKGHPGYSSYPTKVGNPAPIMLGDQVKMWRELTAERDIALYAHHSGVFDCRAAELHPEWAAVKPDGTVSKEKMSVFGGYADGLLIPQLTELALDWHLDGAWVDGECWALELDYSPMALAAWRKISDKPAPKPGEDGYADYLAFLRKGFFDYLTHYIQAVKAKAPNFQITSNWVYSTESVTEPTAPVDFLSGDFSPMDSVNTARFQGRFLACQGIPWDLMAWGFQIRDWNDLGTHSTKEIGQLKQEAAYVMSLGGGFQFYNQQFGGGGTVQEWAIPMWKQTAEFVRAREPYAKGAKLKHETAVFVPTEAYNADKNAIFGKNGATMESAKGLIHLAQDCGMSCEVIESHHLNRISDYKLVMLGRTEALSDASMAALNAYVENGGSLILAAPDTAKRFGFDLGEETEKNVFLESEGVVAPMYVRSADLTPAEGDALAGSCYLDNNKKQGPYPAAVTRVCGKGRITALALDIGKAYPQNRTSCAKRFWKSLASVLYQPTVTVQGSAYAEMTLTERDGRLFVHLLNYGGPHEVANIRGYSEVPSIGPLTVEIHTEQTPKRIMIEPDHIEWTGDMRRVTLDRLDLHTILAVEF